MNPIQINPLKKTIGNATILRSSAEYISGVCRIPCLLFDRE